MKVTKEQLLQESSMSRLYRHNIEHDCSILTAYRLNMTPQENVARNKSLRANLLALGYDLTELGGKYPEGGEDATERSFFIVDTSDNGNLEKDATRLGEKFEQDSVLFMPKGSFNDTSIAYLIGTSHLENAYPPYGKKSYFKKGAFFGEEGEFYTSKSNDRPFTFKEEVKKPMTGNGWWGLRLSAKKDWREFLK